MCDVSIVLLMRLLRSTRMRYTNLLLLTYFIYLVRNKPHACQTKAPVAYRFACDFFICAERARDWRLRLKELL